MTKKCKSCDKPIEWKPFPSTGRRFRLLRGKLHPYNLDGTSHFSTCPQATQWRGKEKKSPKQLELF